MGTCGGLCDSEHLNSATGKAAKPSEPKHQKNASRILTLCFCLNRCNPCAASQPRQVFFVRMPQACDKTSVHSTSSKSPEASSCAFYSIVQHPNCVSLILPYTFIYLDRIGYTAYQLYPTVTRCGVTTFALELDLCLQGRGRSCRGPVINQGSDCLPKWLHSMQENIHGIIQPAKAQALVSNKAVTADKHRAWILKRTDQRLRYCIGISAVSDAICVICELPERGKRDSRISRIQPWVCNFRVRQCQGKDCRSPQAHGGKTLLPQVV